ncbi:multisubstrate pseudouridine synthase 7 [Teratosphaeriaceae sp. CCFEE 6253]|nr:multisubstrate pseudouridine synthase 7 [Teratosphaeriaceae sp. CCFEE 6253]
MATKRSVDGDEVSPNKRIRQDPDRPAAAVPSQADQERAVGITVFVSPHAPGFECVFKHRYTDFLVNEILPSGEVLHLTDTDSRKAGKHPSSQKEASDEVHVEHSSANQDPQPEQATPAIEANGNAGHGNTSAPPDLSMEDRSTLEDIFGEAATQRIVSLHVAVLRNPGKKPRDHATVTSDVIEEKIKRTEAHVAIRRIFTSRLQTKTLQDQPGVIAVKAASSKGPSGPRGQHDGDRNRTPARGKLGWNDLGGEYLHFTLYKENKDTMEVLSYMASQLKIPAKSFEFAGTKDRRGVTVQKIAIFRMRSERLAQLNRNARGWRAGGFEYRTHGLALGDLTGNEFLLTLRSCHFPSGDSTDAEGNLKLAERLVSEAAESFKRNGYLNYYGLQRFGSFSTGTHMTGVKILQGDLGGAVNSILEYSPDLLPENVADDMSSKVPQDDIHRADAIRKWREGSANALDIREMMPRRFSAESAIMQYLSKKDKRSGELIQASDWQGALMQIQRGLRLMYVHAYQSLVWNMAAGKRWELYGNRVVEGDLVIVGEKVDSERKVDSMQVDEDGELVVKPAADDTLAPQDAFTRARPLSEEEAHSGRYDIFDIVLPQPGFDILYPANEIGKYYEDFMGSDAGGHLDPYKMRRSWKDASLSGGYRKMMARPLNGVVDFQVLPYESADDQLVETDLERLRGQERRRPIEAATGVGAAAQNGSDDPSTDALGQHGNGETRQVVGSKIAVVIKFQLGSSQYATMALRELCKENGARAYKPDFNAAR